jgi:hypothetical protein
MLRNVIMKIALFLSAYSSLFLIFLIKNFDTESIRWVFLILTVVPAVLLLLALFFLSRIAGSQEKISKLENINSTNIEFIVAYILPFLALDFTLLPDVISLSILFLILGFIYVRSNLFFMNPTLNLFGYDIVKGYIGERPITIITRRKIDIDKHPITHIAGDAYLGG